MSRLCLMIQNSAGQLSVGLADRTRLVFDSAAQVGLEPSRDIRSYVQAGFRHCGATLDDLARIYVDIGPGGLGATRTAVAFANALGFARDIPVIGVNAFDLLGHHVAKAAGKPVICLRRAARPYVFLGLYENGILGKVRHTDENVFRQMVQGREGDFDYAGRLGAGDIEPASLQADLATMVNTASMQSFLEVTLLARYRDQKTTRADPVTDAVPGATI